MNIQLTNIISFREYNIPEQAFGLQSNGRSEIGLEDLRITCQTAKLANVSKNVFNYSLLCEQHNLRQKGV